MLMRMNLKKVKVIRMVSNSRDHYLTDDVFKKQNSLDSVDQDTEKSKYYDKILMRLID